MLNLYYSFIELPLLSLGLVGELGLIVLITLVGVGLVWGIVLAAKPNAPASPPPGGPVSGGSNEGGAPKDPKDPKDSKWKKIFWGVTIGVTTVVVSAMVAGYIGWNDALFVFKEPRVFVATGIGHLASVVPNLSLSGGEARTFLESIYMETFSKASNSSVVFPKIMEAGVLPRHFLVVQTAIEELGLFPDDVIQNVLSTYPLGAPEATLRVALEIALNDRIDTIILEYADKWF